MKDIHSVRRDHRLELWPFLTRSGVARCAVISVPGMNHPMFVPSARQSRTASRGFSDRQANQAGSSVYNFMKEKIQGRNLSMKNIPCPVSVGGSEWCSDYGIAGGQSFMQSRKSPRHAFTAGPEL